MIVGQREGAVRALDLSEHRKKTIEIVGTLQRTLRASSSLSRAVSVYVRRSGRRLVGSGRRLVGLNVALKSRAVKMPICDERNTRNELIKIISASG